MKTCTEKIPDLEAYVLGASLNELWQPPNLMQPLRMQPAGDLHGGLGRAVHDGLAGVCCGGDCGGAAVHGRVRRAAGGRLRRVQVGRRGRREAGRAQVGTLATHAINVGAVQCLSVQVGRWFG